MSRFKAGAVWPAQNVPSLASHVFSAVAAGYLVNMKGQHRFKSCDHVINKLGQELHILCFNTVALALPLFVALLVLHLHSCPLPLSVLCAELICGCALLRAW